MMRVGFLGLGVMGTPMAVNISRKFPLTVVRQSDIIFMMLFDEQAILAILTDDLRHAFRNKTLVNCSSVSVEFSCYLSEEVHNAGGDFIEMPVSGSKVPAEQGQLVGMMAGNPAVADHTRPYVEPMTSAAVYCGPIGSGLKTKYAVNNFLIIMTAGLAEAMNLARAQGLNTDAFGQVLEAGPMASAYSKLKVGKMLSQDWSAQAGIRDCYNSTQLIQAAAEAAKTQAPLIQLCGSLYKQAIESGLGDEDMISVVKCLAGSPKAQDKKHTRPQ